jgi:hypothetical protein
VLATQNPVDLDYKGLSNAGTWFIGRLQTERDKMRVIEGLESALPGGSYDRAALDKMMSGLTQRVFLMRNVHDDAPVLFQSRWALSYLRGPMTGPEITRLMAPRRTMEAPQQKASQPTAKPIPPSASGVRSSAGAAEYFLPPTSGTTAVTYEPRIAGFAKLHYVDAKLGVDEWRTSAWLAPIAKNGNEVLWAEAEQIADLKARLTSSPIPGATFAELPAAAMRAASFTAWGKALAAHLYESSRADVLTCDALKITSAPGEPEGEFRSRLALAVREKRDAAVEQLRRKYAPKLQALDDRERRAQERVAREKSQLSDQKLHAALSIGASLLGALMGRKTLSATNIGRATSAARAATRVGRESGDVNRADDNLEVIRQQRADLQRQFEADASALESSLDAATVSLRKAAITPRKSDISVGEVALVWVPNQE